MLMCLVCYNKAERKNAEGKIVEGEMSKKDTDEKNVEKLMSKKRSKVEDNDLNNNMKIYLLQRSQKGRCR